VHRILVTDPLHQAGLDLLAHAGNVDVHLLTEEERPRLGELLGEFDAVIVRSGTKLTADLLNRGRRLKVIARAGIGVDNIDVARATELGILVVNSPTANLLSATEHTFALLLALARNIPAADRSMRSGEWNRKGFVGLELQGKTLGIIGFGQIGQRVAERARAFGMEVIASDPFLDPSVGDRFEVELLEMDEMLPRADFVTVHVPLTDQTRGLVGAAQIARMKPGAMLINCARGGIVDELALLDALESDRLAGAAIDVFVKEPPEDRRLVEHPRTVTTPHIGAATREAQERIAVQTVRMLLEALGGSLAVTAVNLPFRGTTGRGEPFLKLGEQLGRLASALSGGSVRELAVDLWGIDEALRTPITVAVVKGALSAVSAEAVNYVNAEQLARGRGIGLVRRTHSQAAEYPHLIGVRMVGDSGVVELSGTVFGDRSPRVVRFGGFQLEFRPEGRLLVLHNQDIPGVVGRIGSLLGDAGINIAEIHLARTLAKDEAMAVLRLDQVPSEEIIATIADLPEMMDVNLVDMEAR
jgi:D-3-phosphoglycerate dehydrogenase